MLEIAYKGIIIGLFVSVPLGPIGMLCIQRTLSKGQKYGIATGLGASLSDVLYTILSLFFLSIVVDFVESFKSVIQIGGSIILLLFGYFIFKSYPSAQPKASESNQASFTKDLITSFGLTASNPLVLFILMAMFAKFDFINPKSTIIETIIGIFSILIGALLWWTTLTFIVSRFRRKINLAGLRTINIVTGVIIMTIGLVGFVLFFKSSYEC